MESDNCKSDVNDLESEIAAAQRVLAKMACGTWEATEIDGAPGVYQVVNQAGYTHQAPLGIATGMTKEDAEGLVFCHNLMPQLLAKITESLPS